MIQRGAWTQSWFPSPIPELALLFTCPLRVHLFLPPGLPGCFTKPNHCDGILTFLLCLLTLLPTSTQHPLIPVIPMLRVRDILLRDTGLLRSLPPNTQVTHKGRRICHPQWKTLCGNLVFSHHAEGLHDFLYTFGSWDSMVLWDRSKVMGFRPEKHEFMSRLHN